MSSEGRNSRSCERGTRPLTVLVVAAAWLVSACSELASGSDRLEDSLQGRVTPGWECLDEPPAPPPAISPTPQYVAYVAPIFDFANPPSTVSGLTVTPCQISDPDCPATAAVGQVLGPQSYTTVLEGATVTVPLYTVVMPYGVSAYLRLTAPNYLRQEYHFGGPMIGLSPEKVMQLPDGTSAAIVEGLPLLMVKESDADLFANQIGLERNADQAIIAVRTIDCNGRPSPGVTLTLDRAKGLAFSYLANLVLSAEDPPQPTDERGLAGFANIALPNNVPIYNVTVEGVSPDGKRFGKLPFFIRPNQMTAGEIRPYPTEYGR